MWSILDELQQGWRLETPDLVINDRTLWPEADNDDLSHLITQLSSRDEVQPSIIKIIIQKFF